MTNSSLEINSKKIQSQNRLIYIRQRNFKLPLLRNEKRKYFANLNEKDIIYNRKFWHTVKTFMSDEIKSRKNLILVNNEKIHPMKRMQQIFSVTFSQILFNLYLKIREYYAERNFPYSLSRQTT